MDAVRIGQMTNADVYLNDNICVGRFSEFGDPEVEYEEVKHGALGMVAEYSAPSRMLKALKGKIEVDFLDIDVCRQFYDPTVAIPLTLDGYVDIFDAGGVAVEKGYRVTNHITFLVFKKGGKPYKFGNDFKGEFEYSASRFVQKFSTESIPLREIDVMNQINRVNGRDVWPRY